MEESGSIAVAFPRGNPGSRPDKSKFRQSKSQIGLSPVRFHDLRHGCASILLAQGIHSKVVQERSEMERVITPRHLQPSDAGACSRRPPTGSILCCEHTWSAINRKTTRFWWQSGGKVTLDARTVVRE
jgi:hypothetical protein